MALTSMTALLAAEASKNATPNPLVLGLTAGGILLVLLLVVSRFNKDR
jgi:hypothetical protein